MVLWADSIVKPGNVDCVVLSSPMLPSRITRTWALKPTASVLTFEVMFPVFPSAKTDVTTSGVTIPEEINPEAIAGHWIWPERRGGQGIRERDENDPGVHWSVRGEDISLANVGEAHESVADLVRGRVVSDGGRRLSFESQRESPARGSPGKRDRLDFVRRWYSGEDVLGVPVNRDLAGDRRQRAEDMDGPLLIHRIVVDRRRCHGLEKEVDKIGARILIRVRDGRAE